MDKKNKGEIDYTVLLNEVDLKNLMNLKNKCNDIDINKIAKALLFYNISNIYVIGNNVFGRMDYQDNVKYISLEEMFDKEFVDIDDIMFGLKRVLDYKENTNLEFNCEFKGEVSRFLYNNLYEMLEQNDLGKILMFNGKILCDEKVSSIYIQKNFYEICDIIKNNRHNSIDMVILKDGEFSLYNIYYKDGKIKILKSNEETIKLYNEPKPKRKHKI